MEEIRSLDEYNQQLLTDIIELQQNRIEMAASLRANYSTEIISERHLKPLTVPIIGAALLLSLVISLVLCVIVCKRSRKKEPVNAIIKPVSTEDHGLKLLV